MPRSSVDTRDEEERRVCGTKGLPAECRGPEREVGVLQDSVWKYVCVNCSEQSRGRGEDTDTWEGILHSLLTWSGMQFLHVNTLGDRC